MRLLTIAAAKGYLLKKAIEVLESCDIYFDEDPSKTRKLFLDDRSGTVRLLMVRPWDVPPYVAQGAADLGIVGKDVLLEQHPDVIDLCDLKFGGCSLVVAGPEDKDDSMLRHDITVATKYPYATEQFFKKKGLKISMVKLYGAIELAPLTGLADVICDLTATGTTLRENKLKVFETIFESTAHLVANKVGFKTHYSRICSIVETIRV
jgi:ATP phosphoribosyltransferase